LLLIDEIAGQRDDAREPVRRRRQSLLVTCAHNDGAAATVKGLGHAEADAAATSGDKNGSVRQVRGDSSAWK
jgi:hypothetical protein